MTQGPYTVAAQEYWAVGWRGLLPLPPRAKKAVPEGWTGSSERDPSWPDVQAWLDSVPEGANIALRLPGDVIGIDVDDYADKGGYSTLLNLIEQLGGLPRTAMVSARDDGVSGIRLFRVPVGLHWPGVLGPGIEVIQRRHRYCVVAPSVHPDTGTEYRWCDSESGEQVPWPRPGGLPELPASWVQAITGGKLQVDVARAELTDAEAPEWLRSVEVLDGERHCRAVDAVLSDGIIRLTTHTAARHDVAVNTTQALVHLTAEGHVGATHALQQFRLAWASAFTADGTARTADLNGEWRRLLVGACRVSKASHPVAAVGDPCVTPFAGLDPDPSHTVTPTTTQSEGASFGFNPARRTWDEAGWASVDPGALSSPGSDAPSGDGRLAPTHNVPLRPDAAELARLAPVIPLTGVAGLGELPADMLATGTLGAPLAALNGGPVVAWPTGPPTTSPEVSEFERWQELARAKAIEVEVDRLRARRSAARQLDDEEALAQWREPMYVRTLTDELALPDSPVAYRVGGVLPVNSNAVLTASFKAGKTTLMNHLVRCLVDGERFLGDHQVARFAGRVGVFNYEVDRDMMRGWLRDAAIDNTDAVSVLHLRGFRLPLTTPRVEQWCVDWLLEHEVVTWIIDPFARAFTGAEENSNTEVGLFLETIDVIKQKSGVAEVIMPVHTGRAEQVEGRERARGATRLDDWTDVRWLLTANDDGERFFRATGRNVELPERKLGYDATERRPFVIGGSRKGDRLDSYDSAIARAIRHEPGMSLNALRRAVKEVLGSADNRLIDARTSVLAERGFIIIDRQPTSTKHWPSNGAGGFAGLVPEQPDAVQQGDDDGSAQGVLDVG